MKKYRNYIIAFFVLLTLCVSICFMPIDATRFIPEVEKQFANELGVQVHVEKLIFRFGPSLKIKAPVMHLMYQDGQKFGQLDNVKFFVPWSTLFKEDVTVKRIYADKVIIKTNSTDKYLQLLIDKLKAREYDSYPNIQFKNYSILYNDNNKNNNYTLKGQNLELTKLENYKNLKLATDGEFFINDKQYISYNIAFQPNIEIDNSLYSKFDINEFIEQIINLDFHSDIIVDLKLYNNFDNELQMSGLINIDNISVLDPLKKNPKSFIYLTFLGNKIGIFSNIYAETDKKIYAQGVVNNSKKTEIDLKVKTDDIKLSEIFKKIKLLVDCSKYKGLDSIEGNMVADFSIKGNLKKLKSTGYMKISNGSIKAGNLNIKNISSNIDFSNNIITIKDAVGYVNKAQILVKGNIDKNIDLNLLMDKVELKHLLPDTLGIQNGIISLNATLTGSSDNIIHKENIQVENFCAVKNKNKLTFDTLKVDTSKDNTAYISNIIIKPEKTENIKIPLLKLVIDNEKLKIPETNIFMPNSKIKAKAEITDFNTSNYVFSSVFEGFINSKDFNGYTNQSAVYPIIFNIYGNKDIQNITGQVHITNTLILDEPSLLNLASKIENNTLKIEDLSLMPFNNKLSSNLKSNLKNNKKIIINGNIEDFHEPTFKNLRVFIPQQINININDIIAQIKCDIFLNGKYNQPEIVGQLSAQNLIVQFAQLIANNITVDFNKNVLLLNIPVIKLGDMSAGINMSMSTDFSKEAVIKTINVKSKYFNTDTILMYKDKFISAFPIRVINGKFYAERLTATLYNAPLNFTAFNSDFSISDNIIHIFNIASELNNGKVAGTIDFNTKDESFSSNIQGRGVSAAPIFDVIALNKDTVSGTMDFDTSLKGSLTSKQSLNGNTKFIVHNGHMGTLGKLEHLLYAQNVIADSMLRTSLSVVTKAITLKDTGLFKYLRGEIVLNDGIANIKQLQSQGPLMSLYVKGQYNTSNSYAKLTVLGRLSDEIVSGLGAFGEFSFNKLMIMLTGEDNKLNIKVEDIDKLPQLPMRNTKEFRTIINGTLEKPSSVVLFNWISYSQKSLRQPEQVNTNEKVPDFIEKLPY